MDWKNRGQMYLIGRSSSMLSFVSLMMTMNCRLFWKWTGTHF